MEGRPIITSFQDLVCDPLCCIVPSTWFIMACKEVVIHLILSYTSPEGLI